MTSDSKTPDPHGGRAGDAPSHHLATTLQCVLRSLQLSVHGSDIRRAAEQAVREAAGDGAHASREQLALAGRLLGLRASVVRGSADDAMAAARPDAPVVFPRGNAAHDAWILSDRRGGSMLAAGAETDWRERWIARRNVRRGIVAGATGDAHEWLTFTVAQPFDARASHGGDGHGRAHPTPIRRLLALLRHDRADMWVVLIFALVVGVMTLATPIAIESLVNTVAFGGLTQPVIVLSLLLFGSLAFAALLRALQAYVVELIQQRLFVRVMADLSHRLPRVEVRAFDRQSGPELVNRFFDILTIQKVSASLLLEGVAVVMSAFIGLVVLAFYHPLLLAFDLVLLLGIVVIVFGLGRGAVRTAIRESLAKYAVAGWLEEVVRHPMAFKLCGGPALALERADQLAAEYVAARQQHFRIVLRQIISALALQVLASTALLGVGGFLVIQGQLTLGQLIAAEIIVTVVVASFAKLGKHMEAFYDLLAAVDKIGHLLDLPLERDGGEALPPGVGGQRPAALDLRRVSFAYDHHGHLLEEISLSVQPGERIAIDGPGGAGKTTLASMIFGLREPTRGRIELDGLDLCEMRLDVLRRDVAMVAGLEIIDADVINNVRLGRMDLSLHDVRAALDEVGILQEIMALPDGLRTELSTSGAPLSYSQARRVMLARAIIGRPRLLLLDEVLDGLDSDAASPVLRAAMPDDRRWTVLLFTRHAESSRRCDRRLRLTRKDADGPGGLEDTGPASDDEKG